MIDNNILEKSIIRGIQDNTKKIYNRSQDTTGCYVPVDTGNLKSSGSVDNTTTGAKIAYTADYAAQVEKGNPATPITEITRVYVPTYRRKNGTVVKGHYKEVQGKIIIFRPKISKFERGEQITRILKEEPAREGQRFVTRAIKRELPSILDDIANRLQKDLGPNVRVKISYA